MQENTTKGSFTQMVKKTEMGKQTEKHWDKTKRDSRSMLESTLPTLAVMSRSEDRRAEIERWPGQTPDTEPICAILSKDYLLK